MKENKGFLLEHIRNELLKYFNFYKHVYSSSLSIDTQGFKIKYTINMDTLQNQISSPQETNNIIDNTINIDHVNKAQEANSLEQLKALVDKCELCGLSKSRINTVFGAGTDRSKLVIIGEAPGAEEDKTGLPFVGRSGKLLTKMLEAIGLSREDVFICNVLKCRPPNNRDPKSEEIKKCSVYLDKQLEILKPKYILALGRISAKRILEKDLTMKDFRKEIHSFQNIPVMVTYHPSALLRNPKWKYDAWEDLKKLKLNLNS